MKTILPALPNIDKVSAAQGLTQIINFFTCDCSIENRRLSIRSLASKIDANSVASVQVGGYTPNQNLTSAKLVRDYCLCAKPNEPRDYRLPKWLGWLGDSIAWDITEEQIDGLLEAL